MSNDENKKYKSKFLTKLTKKKYNLSVISKFIRGNGRRNFFYLILVDNPLRIIST